MRWGGNSIKRTYRAINQWSLFIMVIGLFLSYPILEIGVKLFQGPGPMWKHVSDYLLVQYLSNSFWLLLGTGILTAVVGVLSAWIVVNYEFPFRKYIEWLLFLPITIPSYIVAYAYVGVFDNGGSLQKLGGLIGWEIAKFDVMNVPGLIWVLSFSLYPYVYMATRALFLSQPDSLKNAAFLLGASPRKFFFSIALPLARPAIVGGLFLVFMEVLNDFGAAKYYGVNTFTTGIFRTWTALEDLSTAIYLSALLIALVLFLKEVEKWLRAKKSYAVKERIFARNRVSLKGNNLLLAYVFIGIPIVSGFLLPLFQLVFWAIGTFNFQLLSSFWTVFLQSWAIAATAAFLMVLVALCLVFFDKWNRLKFFRIFPKIATIGYIIPGAIIGIGVMSSNQFVINAFYTNWGIKLGPFLYDSITVLIYAYVVRFLAVAYNPLAANSLKTSPNLASASYLLGKSKLITLFKIELPLLKNTLIGAFLLVFIDTLKELPLTLILKPYKIETLAVKAYEFADDERVADAAIPALLLIITAILAIILLNRWQKTIK